MSDSVSIDDDILVNPMLNSPFEAPFRHLKVGPKGPTGEVTEGRRPSQSFVPIAPAAKKDPQVELDLDTTEQRIQENPLLNHNRHRVAIWRIQNYPSVTPVTRKLLQLWSSLERENRILFCLGEAAETAIFLAEGRDRNDFVNGSGEKWCLQLLGSNPGKCCFSELQFLLIGEHGQTLGGSEDSSAPSSFKQSENQASNRE